MTPLWHLGCLIVLSSCLSHFYASSLPVLFVTWFTAPCKAQGCICIRNLQRGSGSTLLKEEVGLGSKPSLLWCAHNARRAGMSNLAYPVACIFTHKPEDFTHKAVLQPSNSQCWWFARENHRSRTGFSKWGSWWFTQHSLAARINLRGTRPVLWCSPFFFNSMPAPDRCLSAGAWSQPAAPAWPAGHLPELGVGRCRARP